VNTFALFGDNTSESLSPLIYKILSRIYKVDLKYHCFNLNPMDYDFMHLSGFNITSPFKKKTFLKLHSIYNCSQLAHDTGYANFYDNKKKIATNTDVYGIEKTLEAIDINSYSIAIIGAGDVTSSILEVLQDSSINIYNRSDKSADYYNHTFKKLADFKPSDYDFIINSTPLEIDHKFQFDLNYLRYQNQTVSGLSMLIWQAMKNFSLWFNINYSDEHLLKKEILNEIKK